METWLCQVEIKHAEFHRVICSMSKEASAWTNMADRSTSKMKPGHAAYAKRTTATYTCLTAEARQELLACGVPELVNIDDDGETMADRVLAFRKKEAEFFGDLYQYASHRYPPIPF